MRAMQKGGWIGVCGLAALCLLAVTPMAVAGEGCEDMEKPAACEAADAAECAEKADAAECAVEAEGAVDAEGEAAGAEISAP